jgi:hypothetical protein
VAFRVDPQAAASNASAARAAARRSATYASWW